MKSLQYIVIIKGHQEKFSVPNIQELFKHLDMLMGHYGAPIDLLYLLDWKP